MSRTATVAAAGTLLAGLGLALGYSAVEAALNPGYSLVDAYWRGSLPWMGIVEALVVGGATAAVIAGMAAVLIRGGWTRRALVLLPAAVAGLWWLMAVAGAGISGAACAGCERPIDPWAYAYSSPLMTVQMLILPAAAITLLALGRRSPADE